MTEPSSPSSLEAFDVDFARSHCPALEVPVGGTPWALFDNAGGTVVPRQVIDRVTAYMSRYQIQLGASYPLSVEASEAVRAGHRAMVEWLGAEEGEVVLGPSTTVNLDLLARCLRAQWQPGDVVVVTDLDHEANIGCWRRLEDSGIEIRTWNLRTDTADLVLDDLDPLLDDRVRLVAMTQASNVVGRIHDVRAVADRVHDAGALLCVDGVGYAPHRRVDVRALGVDFYAFSLYKAFGPHVGALYGRRELLEAAGNPNHFFIPDDDLPYKLEPAGVCHELVAALPGMLDYVADLDRHHGGDPAEGVRASLGRVFERVAAHEERLAAPLLAFLDAHPKVRIVGPATANRRARLPIVAFVVEGHKSSTIPPQLDREQLAARWGHFYAHRAITALGLHDRDGIVRVSLAHTNTAEEIDRLIIALDRIL